MSAVLLDTNAIIWFIARDRLRGGRRGIRDIITESSWNPIKVTLISQSCNSLVATRRYTAAHKFLKAAILAHLLAEGRHEVPRLPSTQNPIHAGRRASQNLLQVLEMLAPMSLQQNEFLGRALQHCRPRTTLSPCWGTCSGPIFQTASPVQAKDSKESQRCTLLTSWGAPISRSRVRFSLLPCSLPGFSSNEAQPL
jgi:hypothetical protein